MDGTHRARSAGLVLILLLALSAHAFAQPVASGFDAAGMATLRIGSRPDDRTTDAVRLSFGGVLFAGTTGIGSSSRAFVARLLPDGTPDPSFGVGGVAMLPAPSDGFAVAEHPAGGALLAATSGTSPAITLALARFTHTGELHASYGTGGIATGPLPDFFPSAVDVMADGRALVGGSSGDPIRATVIRFTAAGAPDAAYGAGGVATGPNDSSLGRLVVTAGGLVFAAGTAGPFATRDLAAFCFGANGLACPGFAGGTGVATAQIGAGTSVGRDVVRDSANRVIVVGSTESQPFRAVVVRFTPTGALDTTFNPLLGYRLLDFPDNSFSAGVQVDASDRIVIGGLQAPDLFFGTPRLVAAARVTPAGAADATFGTGGVFTANLLGNDAVEGIAIESGTGRILLAGSTGPASGASRSTFSLVLTDGGQPDTSHGPGGAVVSAVTSVVSCSARGIAALPDGRMLVSGSASFPEGERGYLARLNADGTFDASFGTAGTTMLPVEVSKAIDDIVFEPNDRILVSATDPESAVRQLLARFSAGGVLDETFGAAGLATIPQIARPVYIAMTLLPDGGVLASGYQNESPSPLLVAKFTAAGGLDPAFGSGGAVTLPFGMGTDRGRETRALPDGRFLVAATVDGAPALLRLTAAGALDSTFDGDGVVTLGLTGGASDLLSVGDDGILVGGFVAAQGGIVLARFDPEGLPDAAFGTGGTVIDATVAPTTGFVGMTTDDAGCVLAAGTRGPLESRVVALARYLPDGAPDPTYGTAGGVTLDAGAGLFLSDLAVDTSGRALVVGGIQSGTDSLALITRTAAACNDGDACTEDRCVAGVGCTAVQLGGIPGARCLCGVLPAACAGETPPTSVEKKSDKACAALEAAETLDGKPRRRRLNKAQRLFKQAAKKAARATRGKRPALTEACAAALAASFTEQRARAREALDAS